ncbi:DUF4330 family protein [Halomarina halobia]|uniref:DUF4330 family protein n=1 Tax=Halomarina halobia TaxID=3033386 RepID=A0ABD6A952_9EURY|nr:DUF4330 family protein [Halomarina sp. PSR21]
MRFIDEEGRVFGRVNVVDALVVALVASVLVAGVALVSGADEPEASANGTDAATYATVSFGSQPDYLAAAVESNDTVAVGDATARITDVYAAPGQGGTAVYARLAFPDATRDAGARAAGEEALRLGSELPVTTPTYRLSSRIVALDGGPTLPVEDRSVVVEATTHPAVAEAIDAGDVSRVAGRPVARVETVESVAGNSSNSTVRLRLSLRTLARDDVAYFGDAPVRLGARIRFESDAYAVTGTVVALPDADADV